MKIEKFVMNDILKIGILTENEFYTTIIEINVRNEYLRMVNQKDLEKSFINQEIYYTNENLNPD